MSWERFTGFVLLAICICVIIEFWNHPDIKVTSRPQIVTILYHAPNEQGVDSKFAWLRDIELNKQHRLEIADETYERLNVGDKVWFQLSKQEVVNETLWGSWILSFGIAIAILIGFVLVASWCEEH